MVRATNLQTVAVVALAAAICLDGLLVWLTVRGQIRADTAFADGVLATAVAWVIIRNVLKISFAQEKKAVRARLERAYRQP